MRDSAIEKKETRRLPATGFAPLPAGAILHPEKRYELLQCLDQSASLNVYLVRHLTAQQEFVLYEADDADHFAHQVEVVSRHLTHPALVLLADAFVQVPYETASRSYLVSEYPLASVTAWGTPTEAQVVQWGVSLAQALAYLHQNGLVHGNVQAAGLVLSNRQIKLGNYGSVSAFTTEGAAQDVRQLAQTLVELAAAPGQSGPVFSAPTTEVFRRALEPEGYTDAQAFAADLERALARLQPLAALRLQSGFATMAGAGPVRNTDSILALEATRQNESEGEILGLYALASGQGTAGGIASQAVTRVLARELLSGLFTPQFSSPGSYDANYAALLQAAASLAYAEASEKGARQVTFIAALVAGMHVYVTRYAGGSAYGIADGQVTRLATADAAGSSESEPVLWTAEETAHLLLCTDSLVAAEAFMAGIAAAPTPQKACNQLVAANASAIENQSCIVVRFVNQKEQGP